MVGFMLVSYVLAIMSASFTWPATIYAAVLGFILQPIGWDTTYVDIVSATDLIAIYYTLAAFAAALAGWFVTVGYNLPNVFTRSAGAERAPEVLETEYTYARAAVRWIKSAIVLALIVGGIACYEAPPKSIIPFQQIMLCVVVAIAAPAVFYLLFSGWNQKRRADKTKRGVFFAFFNDSVYTSRITTTETSQETIAPGEAAHTIGFAHYATWYITLWIAAGCLWITVIFSIFDNVLSVAQFSRIYLSLICYGPVAIATFTAMIILLIVNRRSRVKPKAK
jgi:hypothetical protein